MKILKFRKPVSGRHQHFKEDVQRIVSVCKDKGYELSEENAMIAWEKYSEDYYAAGWLILPKKDEDVVNAILKVMEEEE